MCSEVIPGVPGSVAVRVDSDSRGGNVVCVFYVDSLMATLIRYRFAFCLVTLNVTSW